MINKERLKVFAVVIVRHTVHAVNTCVLFLWQFCLLLEMRWKRWFCRIQREPSVLYTGSSFVSRYKLQGSLSRPNLFQSRNPRLFIQMQIGETCAKFVRILLETRYPSWTKKDRLHASLRGLCWEWINVTLVKNRKTRGYAEQGDVERRKREAEMKGQSMKMNKDGRYGMKHCNGPFGSKPLGFRTYRALRYTECTLCSDHRELLNVTIKCCDSH